MTELFLFDENPKDLETAEWLLGKHRIGTRDSALQIRSFSNRNALLSQIALTKESSLALIDLQADDYLDNNYSGHRIIETIRRHPRLAACRPLAFTIHDRDDVIQLAQDHGAFGLVRRAALEVRNEESRALAIEKRLLTILKVSSVAATGPGTFSLIPQSSGAAPDPSEPDVHSALLSVFTYRVDDGRAAFWDYIRYYADNIDPESIKRWVMQDHSLRINVVKEDMNQLGRAARPRFRSRGLDMTQLARTLLEMLPTHRLAPDETLSLRTLHRFTEAAVLVHDKQLVAASFVDAEAVEALRTVLAKIIEIEMQGPHPRTGHWWYSEALRGVLKTYFADDAARLQPALIRGVNALFDADATSGRDGEDTG